MFAWLWQALNNASMTGPLEIAWLEETGSRYVETTACFLALFQAHTFSYSAFSYGFNSCKITNHCKVLHAMARSSKWLQLSSPEAQIQSPLKSMERPAQIIIGTRLDPEMQHFFPILCNEKHYVIFLTVWKQLESVQCFMAAMMLKTVALKFSKSLRDLYTSKAES